MVPIVRLIVAVVSVLAIVGGLVSAFFGAYEGLFTVAVGAIGLFIVVNERQRYTAEHSGERLQRTDEVFTDPTTGERTRVWIDPESGARSYRPE
jgi:hypothetical protein